jgi:hypothetical protein
MRSISCFRISRSASLYPRVTSTEHGLPWVPSAFEVKQRPDHPLTVVVAASGDRRKASRRQNLLPLITVSCADPVGLSRKISTALNEADSGWVSRVKRFSLKDRAFVMQRAGYMGSLNAAFAHLSSRAVHSQSGCTACLGLHLAAST